MDKVFVIGDIHGSFKLLETILPNWNPKEEQLVFLGDYIDRGPDSLKVLQTVMQLSEKYGAITLSGNHEQLFLNWLEKPKELSNFYFQSKIGGLATIQCLYTSPIEASKLIKPIEIAEAIQLEHAEVIQFMKQLKKYYSWDPYLFVHAGIDAKVENFVETKEDDFLWIRDDFTSMPHKAKEIVVFGHTPTIFLNEDKTSKVWISPCRKKIGVDGGGAIYEGGYVHGVVLSKDSTEFTVYSAGINEELTSSVHFL